MIQWAFRAASDLLALGDFIAKDNPKAAHSWVERLRSRAMIAAKVPRSGRVVPEIGRYDVREIFLRSYRIVYRVLPEGIVVLTVFEGHRLLSDLNPDVDE